MGAIRNKGQDIATSRPQLTPHKGAHSTVIASETAALTQSTDSNSGLVTSRISPKRVKGLTP